MHNTLHVHIDVHADGEGEWEYDHHVPIPDHPDDHLIPFIEHQVEKAVTEFERTHFGYARGADALRQYDVRMRVIEHLLKTAPHRVRNAAVIAKVFAVMHMDARDLFTQYGDYDIGH